MQRPGATGLRVKRRIVTLLQFFAGDLPSLTSLRPAVAGLRRVENLRHGGHACDYPLWLELRRGKQLLSSCIVTGL